MPVFGLLTVSPLILAHIEYVGKNILLYTFAVPAVLLFIRLMFVVIIAIYGPMLKLYVQWVGLGWRRFGSFLASYRHPVHVDLKYYLGNKGLKIGWRG